MQSRKVPNLSFDIFPLLSQGLDLKFFKERFSTNQGARYFEGFCFLLSMSSLQLAFLPSNVDWLLANLSSLGRQVKCPSFARRVIWIESRWVMWRTSEDILYGENVDRLPPARAQGIGCHSRLVSVIK